MSSEPDLDIGIPGDPRLRMKKRIGRRPSIQRLFMCSAACSLYGAVGFIFLVMFGTLIISDSYPFRVVEKIHEDKYGRASGCYVAAVIHLLVFVVAGLSTCIFGTTK